MAKQINILFGVNTFGGPRSIVLHGGLNPCIARRGGFDAAFAKLLWPLVVVTYAVSYLEFAVMC